MLLHKPFGTGFAFLPAGITRVLCALILLGANQAAFGQTWNGNGGTVFWSNGTNWTGGAPTGSSTTNLTFAGSNNTGSPTPLNQDIASTFSLNSITFSAGAGSFSLAGNALAFVGPTGATNNVITQNSSSAQTIANTIAANNNNITLTLAGSGTGIVTLSGAILFSNGQKDYAITKTGTSTFILSGANTYQGATTISAGVLNIQNSAGLGSTVSGTSVTSGAALQLQGGIGVANEALTLNGSGVASDGALRNISGNNSYGGLITLGSASKIASDSGTLTLTAGIVNGGFLLTFDGNGNNAESGVISGTGGLVKNSSGTLTLSGINTFSGGSTLNGGTTVISNSSSLGATTGAATINSATLEVAATFASARNFTLSSATSTLQIDPTFAYTVTGIFSGTGTLNKTGTGTLVLGGVNTYSGATNITAGTLREGLSTAIPNTSAVTVSTGATYDLNSFSETIGSIAGGGTVTSNAAGALTLTAGGDNTSTLFSGVIQNGSGTMSFTKTGTGTLTFSGVNTYSGLTTVNAGTLNVQSASALGTTAGGTTVASGATLQLQGGISIGAEPLTLNGTGVSGFGALRNFSGNNSSSGAINLASTSTIGSDSGTLTLSGVISGTGALVKTGSGTLSLSGVNTFLGGTTINGGTLVVTSDSNFGALTGAIGVNAGTLEVASGFSTARTINVNNASSTFQVDAGQTFTVSTPMTGSGTLNKTGAGTMLLSIANVFTGGTNVTAGTLQLGVINGLATTATLTISGGTFDLQTFGQTTGTVTLASGTISGTGAGTLTGSSFTLQSGTVSGILGGTGTVTKNTAGTVILSGANSYTGSTTISAGTLQVNTNNALGTAASGTTVANGAVLKLNNVNYTTAEPVTLNGSGISNGGALLNSGTSTFAGPINAATNATINAGGAGNTLNLTGGISKNGTTLTFAGGGTVNINTNGITGASANSDLVVDNTTVNENVANSYNGPTYIRNGGILNANVANALPTSNGRTSITMDDSGSGNSQLTLGAPQAVASLTGAATSSIKLNANTLTVGNSSGTTTFAGVISGTGGLIKDSASTQILTGVNTYSGSTTVNGGTLIVNASGAALASTSNVTVNSGGTLLLGGSDQINNTATMTLNGGTYAKGNFSEGTASSPGTGALTLTASGSKIDFGTGSVGVLTFASFTPGAFTLSIDNWTGNIATLGSATTDRLIFASDQASNLNNFSFTGFGPGAVEFNLNNGYWEVTPATPVPETSTWVAAALAVGVVAFHLVRRRRALVAVRSPRSPGNFPKSAARELHHLA